MKYYVRVVRPRFEVRLIEVEADEDDPAEAELKAVQEALKPSRAWRLVRYDDTDYGPHPEALISQDEVDDALHETPDVDPRAELASNEPFSGAAYMLMFADPESGEGQIIWEPWFSGVSTLMAADLCEDWRQDLEWMTPDDPFEGMDVPDKKSAKILFFQRRRRPRANDDDEPPPAA